MITAPAVRTTDAASTMLADAIDLPLNCRHPSHMKPALATNAAFPIATAHHVSGSIAQIRYAAEVRMPQRKPSDQIRLTLWYSRSSVSTMNTTPDTTTTTAVMTETVIRSNMFSHPPRFCPSAGAR